MDDQLDLAAGNRCAHGIGAHVPQRLDRPRGARFREAVALRARARASLWVSACVCVRRRGSVCLVCSRASAACVCARAHVSVRSWPWRAGARARASATAGRAGAPSAWAPMRYVHRARAPSWGPVLGSRPGARSWCSYRDGSPSWHSRRIVVIISFLLF